MNAESLKRQASRKATQIKRQFQDCKVFELKLDYSRLNKEELTTLKMFFVEAKWLYNYILSQKDPFKYDYKINPIQVMNKDKELVEKELKYLPAKCRQDVVYRVQKNICKLSKLKKKGKQVGRLKFKSDYFSIDLSQFNVTHKVFPKTSTIKVVGIPRYLKVYGLAQIPENVEFANAHLIKKASGYYMHVTTFLPKETKVQAGNSIGLDFGIKTPVTDSNGNKYNFQFPETNRLKQLSKHLSRCKKGSKNRYKVKLDLGKEYEYLTNTKKDTINKFIHALTSNNDLICIQDEMIHQWKSSKQRGFGRKIQHGILGGIISGLKKHPETLTVPRSFPSTQLCPQCGSLNKHDLSMRIYNCSCGYSEDRDIHSARNILNYGLSKISTEHRDTMLDEEKTSESCSLDSSHASLKQEASYC